MQSKLELELAILLFPLRSLSFYKKDLFVQIASEKKYNDKLQKDIIEHIRWELSRDYKFHSIDEIRLILKKFYPFIFRIRDLSKESSSVKMVLNEYFQIINKLSKSLVSHRDGKLTYKYWKNDGDDKLFGPYDEFHKIQIFNYISRMIPIDIVAVNYLLENEMKEIEQLDGFYSSIMLPDMQLEDILLSGVAENHVHAGASFNFIISWNIMMNQFKVTDKEYIKLFNSYCKNREYNMQNYILACGILRLLISVYLKNVNEKKHKGKFIDWIAKYYNDKTSISEFVDVLSKGEDLDLWINKKKIVRDNDTEFFETFEKVWNEIISYNAVEIDEDSEDFIFDIFYETKGIKTYGENIFLFYCLRYIKNKKEDVMFSELFLNYIRIKTTVFNTITQEGHTLKGLDHFKEYYAKASKSVKMINGKIFWKTFFRTMFQNNFLKKLEVRISQNNNFKKNIYEILSAYKEVIDEDFKSVGKNEFPMFGIVIHLLKKEDEEEEEKCWLLYDEKNENSIRNIYFGNLQNKYFNEVNELVQFRNSIPYLSEFLLGLDAASGENDTPISVFAPIFKKARDSKSQKLSFIKDDGKIIRNKSLSFTFHAGEDFRHLLSGLRRIDEVIKHCKFHAGDRIGHGIALGVNVQYWKDVNPVVIIPRGEYLDNLLWVWGIYASEKSYDPKINIYLENQIYKYAKDIYENMNGINTAMLYDAYIQRFEKFEVSSCYSEEINCQNTFKREIFCKKVNESHVQIWTTDKLNHAYNCKCYLKQIYEPVQVAVTDLEVDMISQIQQIIHQRVASKGIVIEVNPTSNLVIGEMDSLFNNQAYIINNIFESKHNNIMLNINSDDPTVFNTNVSNEIAYLYYGLLYRKVSREEALGWIDKIRDYGMKTSFINSQVNYDQYYKYLDEVLSNLRE
jgi:adenosine deaminase